MNRRVGPWCLVGSILAAAIGAGGCGTSPESPATPPSPDAGVLVGGPFRDDGGTSSVDASCAVNEATARRPPVDVIVAIDSSTSMQDDANQVQSNLNRLSDTLEHSGLDYHLILVALHYDGPGNATKVCVPPPLGGASCGASNPPRFRHVNQTIESNNMLKVLLFSYDLASSPGAPWADALRRDSLKVFVPVTDDDSTPGGNAWDGISASDFEARLLAKASAEFGSAAHPRYVFYPIVGAPDYPAESPKCGANAVNTGAQYIDLAKRTNGKWFSICTADFGPIFDDVAKRISDRLSCEVALPSAPGGDSLDRSRVNVALTPTGGVRNVIPQDPSRPCDGGADGWQYAPDGASVLLCGPTCERARSDVGAKITVELGCTTRLR